MIAANATSAAATSSPPPPHAGFTSECECAFVPIHPVFNVPPCGGDMETHAAAMNRWLSDGLDHAMGQMWKDVRLCGIPLLSPADFEASKTATSPSAFLRTATSVSEALASPAFRAALAAACPGPKTACSQFETRLKRRHMKRMLHVLGKSPFFLNVERTRRGAQMARPVQNGGIRKSVAERYKHRHQTDDQFFYCCGSEEKPADYDCYIFHTLQMKAELEYERRLS